MTEERIVEFCSGYSHKLTIYSGACVECGEVFFTHSKKSKGFCGMACTGIAKSRDYSGAGSWRWRGGRCVQPNGYVYVHAIGHPEARLNKVAEHRLVMEKHIGRFLLPGENVHHKNGIRHDNRIENLELWVKPQTPGQRVEDLISWMFDNYNKEIRAKIAIQDLVRSVIKRVKTDTIKNGGD